MISGHWPEYTDAAQARHGAVYRDELGHTEAARGDYDAAQRHWRYAEDLRRQAVEIEDNILRQTLAQCEAELAA